jgi:glycosyltransferase involved in cell wall biosynthesis
MRAMSEPIMPLTVNLKILVAHTSYQQRGGEDVAVEAEVELLRSFGHEVVEYRRDNTTIESTKHFDLLRETLWSSSSADTILNLVQDRKVDVLHAHNTFPLLSPAIYWGAASAGVPVVQTLHNYRLLCAQAMFLRDGTVCEDCLGKLPWRGVTRKCYRDSTAKSAALVGMLGLHRLLGSYRNKVTRYIALSEFSKQKFVAGGLPHAKVAVKPNFADVSPPIDGARIGGLFVGRLSQEKGLHLLLEALRMSPNITCTIVGDGPQRDLVSAGGQINFLGACEPDRVYAQMRKAAYLVMPSICYEQFPRTLVEAFACGLPIIASRLGPLAELVEDEKTGLLFDPGSAEDLSNKLRFAEARPQIMREMGTNARAEYELKYTPGQNYQQLMGIYAEAISTNKMQLSLSYGPG